MTNSVRTFAAKRARLPKLHKDGLSASAIGRELGVSKSTVSKWAREHTPPLLFDRARTAEAVAAHTIDLAAGRQRLAEKMLAESEAMLDRINDPYIV